MQSRAYRVNLENIEAKMWQDLVALPQQSPEFRIKHAEHQMYFSILRIIEQNASKLNYCVECHEIGSSQCGGCNNEIYCSKECQRKDWPRHKIICNTNSEPQEIIPAFIADKPLQVILVLRKGILSVQMNQEDMMNYQLYIKAIKEALPDFDEEKQFGWQHWTTVREAWNPHRS